MAAYLVIALMTCGLVAVVLLVATFLAHHAGSDPERQMALRADHLPHTTVPFDPRF